MLGTRVAQTPVVVNVPEARVDAVDDTKRHVRCLGGGPSIQAVDAQCYVEEDRRSVLSPVEQVGKFVARIPVTAKTLK